MRGLRGDGRPGGGRGGTAAPARVAASAGGERRSGVGSPAPPGGRARRHNARAIHVRVASHGLPHGNRDLRRLLRTRSSYCSVLFLLGGPPIEHRTNMAG